VEIKVWDNRKTDTLGLRPPPPPLKPIARVISIKSIVSCKTVEAELMISRIIVLAQFQSDFFRQYIKQCYKIFRSTSPKVLAWPPGKLVKVFLQTGKAFDKCGIQMISILPRGVSYRHKFGVNAVFTITFKACFPLVNLFARIFCIMSSRLELIRLLIASCEEIRKWKAKTHWTWFDNTAQFFRFSTNDNAQNRTESQEIKAGNLKGRFSALEYRNSR
jgi:hypothetical protein